MVTMTTPTPEHHTLERELYHYATLKDPYLKGRSECSACGIKSFYQFPMSSPGVNAFPCDACGAPESVMITQILYVVDNDRVVYSSLAAELEVILYENDMGDA